jgi:hypothetical protein
MPARHHASRRLYTLNMIETGTATGPVPIGPPPAIIRSASRHSHPARLRFGARASAIIKPNNLDIPCLFNDLPGAAGDGTAVAPTGIT